MLDIYSKLAFDDPDGGVWKQGYDIVYSQTSVRREKRLEVIVVPHSHNDPGYCIFRYFSICFLIVTVCPHFLSIF